MEFARLLIAHGADPNVIDGEYEAAPHGSAAKYGQIEMARLLLA